MDNPRQILPARVKEGRMLTLNFELGPEGEKKHRVKIEGLLDKLKRKSKE